MPIKINVPVNSSKQRTRHQLRLVYNLLYAPSSKQLKVLEYMLRHSSGGMYAVKRNYRDDIAKYANTSNEVVKGIVKNLMRKRMITYVDNSLGNNLGLYTFHPALQAICANNDSITFTFVNK